MRLSLKETNVSHPRFSPTLDLLCLCACVHACYLDSTCVKHSSACSNLPRCFRQRPFNIWMRQLSSGWNSDGSEPNSGTQHVNWSVRESKNKEANILMPFRNVLKSEFIQKYEKQSRGLGTGPSGTPQLRPLALARVIAAAAALLSHVGRFGASPQPIPR